MKKVNITYKNGTKITFTADQLFYKTEWWMQEIGYLPAGKSRKKWFPVGGRHDDNNDYTETLVEIEEV